MKFPLFTLCGAAACLLASCGSIQTLTFDQLYPASLTYPEQVTRVAVVNNVPPVPSSGEKKLTLGVLEGDGKIAAETLCSLPCRQPLLQSGPDLRLCPAGAR